MPREPAIYAVVPGGTAAPGGMSRMARHIAEAWARAGLQPPLRVIDSTGGRRRWGTAPHFALICLRILHDGLRGRIALLHLHIAEGGSLLRKGTLLLLGRMLGVPVVLHLHGARFAGACNAMPNWLRRLLVALLGQADLLLTLGTRSHRFLTGTLGLPGRRVLVLANAVPAACHGPARADGGPCRLLFLGALGPRKGLDVLLDALTAPGLAGADWDLRIAGDGDTAPWCRAVQARGLADRTRILGWVDPAATSRLLAEADILLLPSRHEGLPVAILEAMARGVPVIATDVGDVADAVGHGLTGLLVPPGDAAALAAAIVQLVTAPALRARMGAAARARHAEAFELRAYAAQLAGILRAVRARRARPAAGRAAAVWLGGSVALGQALALLAAPALTRLYPADAFGLFGLFSGVVTSIGAVATLKYEQAIVLERRERGAADVMRLCLLLALASSLICLGVFTALAAEAPAVPALRLLAVWGAPAVLCIGLFNALGFWAMRAQAWGPLGAYQLGRSGFAVALQLAASVLLRGPMPLVGGQVVGQGTAIVLLACSSWRRLAALRHGTRRRRLLAAARRHSGFAVYGAPQTLGHLLSVNLPSILLPLTCGAGASGLFWLAWRVLVLPNQVLVESLRSVLFRRAASLHAEGGDLDAAMRRAAWRLALLGLPVVVVLFAAGPALFAMVFGPQWRQAGAYAAIMALPWWVETCAMPSSVLVAVLRLQRGYLLIEIGSLAGRTAALLLGAAAGGATLAVALYALVSVAASLALIGHVGGALRQRRRHPVLAA
jgi:glycosyltransferase involved in cell wall biosynthesis/O-antigen/teichoic acid export membrane protein